MSNAKEELRAELKDLLKKFEEKYDNPAYNKEHGRDYWMYRMYHFARTAYLLGEWYDEHLWDEVENLEHEGLESKSDLRDFLDVQYHVAASPHYEGGEVNQGYVDAVWFHLQNVVATTNGQWVDQ